MKLKHFLEDINSLIRAGLLNEYSEVGATEIRANSCDLFFNNSEDEYTIENLRSDIRNNETEIDELSEDNGKLKLEIGDLERKIEEISDILSQIEVNKGESVKDLLERIKWQEEEIFKYKKGNNQFFEQYKQDQETIKKLRARKNKVEVKKSLTTGQLGVSFNGVEYELTEIKK